VVTTGGGLLITEGWVGGAVGPVSVGPASVVGGVGAGGGAEAVTTAAATFWTATATAAVTVATDTDIGSAAIAAASGADAVDRAALATDWVAPELVIVVAMAI